MITASIIAYRTTQEHPPHPHFLGKLRDACWSHRLGVFPSDLLIPRARAHDERLRLHDDGTELGRLY